MKLKFVRHRLRPVIGFENSQFKFHHVESKCRQSQGLSSMTKYERLLFHCLDCQAHVCVFGGQRNKPNSSTYQFTSRRKRDSCRGKKAEQCQSRQLAGKRREHILPQVKERSEDLKGEGRRSHVMHTSSTEELSTNTNPRSALCANYAKSLGNSHWLAQEGSQQNRVSVTHFPWNSTYPS